MRILTNLLLNVTRYLFSRSCRLSYCLSLSASLFIFAVIPTETRAGYGNVFGMGPISIGMGTTSLHNGEVSAFHAHQNPAMLGYATESQISLGLINTDPHLNAFGTVVVDESGTVGEFTSSGVLGSSGQTVGMVLPIGKTTRPLTIGLNVYLSGKSLSRVSGPPINFPFYPVFQDVTRNTNYTVSVAYRIWNGLSLGLTGTTSLLSLADYQLTNTNNVSFSASAVEVRTIFRPGFALAYDFKNDSESTNAERSFLLGFMYRAKSELKTKLTANINVLGNLVQGELSSFPQFSPAEWTLAASKRLSDAWVIAADLSYVQWADYKNPFGDGNVNSFIFGGGLSDAGFKNIITPKVGAEYSWQPIDSFIKKWSLRGGYYYSASPVPDQVGNSNYADSDKHGVSIGLGIAIKNPWIGETPKSSQAHWIRFDLFGQLTHLESRDVRKSSVTALGAPGYTAGGNIWAYGLHTSLSF